MSDKADRQLVVHPCGLLAEHENPMAERRIPVISPIGELEPTLQQFNSRV